MAKDFALKFYNSKRWKHCRQSYFTYRHGLCERCQDPGKIVHHKEYLTTTNINDPMVSLSFDNLELLCQTCHNREHHEKYGVTMFGVMFDENGDLVEFCRK
jgi:5-methylcytosine-specific restriction endonuclease McrA